MPVVNCATCGDEVEKPPHKIERNDNHFCSRECYHEFGRPDMQGENNPNHKEKVELDCEVCGDPFEVYPYRADDARFCSSDCNRAYLRGQTGKDHPQWNGGEIELTCQNCGEIFTDYPSHSDREYCSKQCYREASEEIFAGDGNPVWRGGHPDYYGPNWEEQRQAAIERDDHRCQDCGKHADEMEVSPDVHHKTRLGWFKEEYDAPLWWQEANVLENLVTLCASCHKKREWSQAD